jgi:hypothetical protein
MVKAIHCRKPISRRPIRRPQIRWEDDDDVRKDIQKLNVQIGRPSSRIEEDGRSWLRRPELCIKSRRAIIIIIIRRRSRVVPKYLNSSTFSKELLSVFVL